MINHAAEQGKTSRTPSHERMTTREKGTNTFIFWLRKVMLKFTVNESITLEVHNRRRGKHALPLYNGRYDSIEYQHTLRKTGARYFNFNPTGNYVVNAQQENNY